jgi:hypothetical protein
LKAAHFNGHAARANARFPIVRAKDFGFDEIGSIAHFRGLDVTVFRREGDVMTNSALKLRLRACKRAIKEFSHYLFENIEKTGRFRLIPELGCHALNLLVRRRLACDSLCRYRAEPLRRG